MNSSWGWVFLTKFTFFIRFPLTHPLPTAIGIMCLNFSESDLSFCGWRYLGVDLVLGLNTMHVASTWVLTCKVPCAQVGLKKRMAVEGAVLRKMTVEEDKFAWCPNNFQKWVYFEPNLGRFYGFSGKFCSLGGWVLNFLTGMVSPSMESMFRLHRRFFLGSESAPANFLKEKIRKILRRHAPTCTN